MPTDPVVSFVIASFNRRDVLLGTLGELGGPSAPSHAFEIIVVDNRSRDGTADAVRAEFPRVSFIDARRNLGACAKTLGVEHARGTYTVFLDDDSHPAPGAVDRMIGRFESDPALGVAGFRVFLPDGREECSALPNVFIGCGAGFRTSTLRQVGGLDLSLFMAAEEYDLSFRLVNAGWGVETFDDLRVEHLKTATGRRGTRPVYYDTRNNLLVAARYLPDALYRDIRRDWMQRYRWMSQRERRVVTHLRASLVGRLKALRDRRRYADHRLNDAAVETLFRFGEIQRAFEALKAEGVERVVLADLGKNILAFHRGAARAGVCVAAIGDDRFAAPGRCYRTTPVLPIRAALSLPHDAVVVSNTSPVHAAATNRRLRGISDRPVYAWFAASPAPTPASAREGVPPCMALQEDSMRVLLS